MCFSFSSCHFPDNIAQCNSYLHEIYLLLGTVSQRAHFKCASSIKISHGFRKGVSESVGFVPQSGWVGALSKENG